jgi:nitronate monooxygenase
VASEESGAHPSYKAALVAAGGPLHTVLTTHFDAGWPDAPHRVLRAALARAERTGNRNIDPPSRDSTGDVSGMAMYAGEGVGAIRHVTDAHALTLDLVSAIA